MPSLGCLLSFTQLRKARPSSGTAVSSRCPRINALYATLLLTFSRSVSLNAFRSFFESPDNSPNILAIAWGSFQWSQPRTKCLLRASARRRFPVYCPTWGFSQIYGDRPTLRGERNVVVWNVESGICNKWNYCNHIITNKVID